MTGGRASVFWLIGLAAGIALFAGIWLVPHLHRVAEQSDTLARLESEGEALSSRVRDLTQELNGILAGTDDQPGLVQPDVSKIAERIRREEEAKRLEHVRQLAATEAKLEEARLTIDELTAKVEGLQAQVASLEEDNRILADKEQDLIDQLERSNRVVEAIRSEMQGTTDRMVRVETRNRTLREQNRELEDQAAKTRRLVLEIENVQRRREALLTNISRRFRDVADEFRAVALGLNSADREAEQSVDLSRIQNVLTLADEDLRQLESLNTRASQLQQQLSR